jgi:hypothetical protein
MPLSVAKPASVALVLISGLAFASPPPDAPAQAPPSKLEVGPGPYNVDLDAGSGEYEERYIQAPTGPFIVKGLIQFKALHTSARWEPMAAVELMGRKDSFFAGLMAFVQPNARVPFIQFAVRNERLNGLPTATFAGVQYTDKLIPFELHLDKSGVLQVSVADKTGRPLPIRPLEVTRVHVLASNAHIRFVNIEVSPSDR